MHAAVQRSKPEVPEEPAHLRGRTRALIEDSPAAGERAVRDGGFLAEVLWETWGDDLSVAGMGYEEFLGIVRGYAGEVRLWVVGERTWEHCASGLAGRVVRRMPRPGLLSAEASERSELAATPEVRA